jgi:hypothetical protein
VTDPDEDPRIAIVEGAPQLLTRLVNAAIGYERVRPEPGVEFRFLEDPGRLGDQQLEQGERERGQVHGRAPVRQPPHHRVEFVISEP